MSMTTLFLLPVLLTAVVLDAGDPGSVTFLWMPLAGLLGICALSVFSVEDRRRMLRPAMPLLLLAALMAIYVFNPTHHWQDGSGLTPAVPLPGVPGSADPVRSLKALGIAWGAITVFLLGRCIRYKYDQALKLVLLAGGAAIALSVIHQRLVPRPFYDYTATFVSQNHFVAFANLLLPIALVSASRAQYRKAQTSMPSSPAGLFYLAAGLLISAILMTGSRMGASMLFFSLGAWSFLQLRLDRCYRHLAPTGMLWGRLLPALTGLMALGALVFGVFRGTTGKLHFWGDLRFRSRILADTLDLWRDNLYWGTGPGTFASVFPYYQSDSLQAYVLAHAHCDPLQFLAEFGLVGATIGVLAIGFAIGACRCGLRKPSTDWPRVHELEIPGYAMALTTVLLHSLIDFPFRAPAILLLAALWASRLCCERNRFASIP